MNGTPIYDQTAWDHGLAPMWDDDDTDVDPWTDEDGRILTPGQTPRTGGL